VLGASSQLCKLKGGFYHTDLVKPKIWIFTLSAKISFQPRHSAFTGKENRVRAAERQAENQQILQRVASERC